MVQLPMLEHALPSNQLQIQRAIGRVMEDGHTQSIGMFGLAFKDGTDDLRESPMVTMAEFFLGKGRRLTIYDPTLKMGRILGTNRTFALQAIPHLENILVEDPAQVVKKSDTVLVTRHFKEMDWRGLPWQKSHRILDLVGVDAVKNLGCRYDGLYW